MIFSLRLIFIITFGIFPLFVYAVQDDIGNNLVLKKPPKRIISLAPDITEILFAIGAGNQVVGVVEGTDYPAAAKQITRVGSYSGIDLEKIVNLHPDLIIVWDYAFARQLTVLKKFAIPIYTTRPRYLPDIARTMKNLGELTGNTFAANQAANDYLQSLERFSLRYQSQAPVTVFYQIGSYSLMTINQDSWINQVITLCGGRNVFAKVQSIAAEISWEALVLANPEVILSDTSEHDWQARFTKRPEILAVKKRFVIRG